MFAAAGCVKPEIPVRHVTAISDLSAPEIEQILDVASQMKVRPAGWANAMNRRTLLMLFEKPSLRTRVSFETGMTQMGGHAIFYSIADSPLGKKESYYDTSKVISRFVDICMARVKSKDDIDQLAGPADIPIINGLDDNAHPCQILTDLLTIKEHKGTVTGFKMAYFGDCKNNMTYDLMRAACVMGFDIAVSGPAGDEYTVPAEVRTELDNILVQSQSGGSYVVTSDPVSAAKDADVVYADSWMSYGIPKAEEDARKEVSMPYQVNKELMAHAAGDAVFMNCLPAIRGMEQTADVIDGPQSIVFDQAENRLHSQKALMHCLLNGFPM
jgi:ornithine carbamoyltransferase